MANAIINRAKSDKFALVVV